MKYKCDIYDFSRKDWCLACPLEGHGELPCINYYYKKNYISHLKKYRILKDFVSNYLFLSKNLSELLKFCEIKVKYVHIKSYQTLFRRTSLWGEIWGIKENFFNPF